MQRLTAADSFADPTENPDSSPARELTPISKSTMMLLSAAISFLAAGLMFLVLFEGDIGLAKHSLGLRFGATVVLVGLWLTAIIFFWFYKQKRRDPFEAPVLFSLALFGLGPLVIWLFMRDYAFVSPWLTFRNRASSAVYVTILTGAAVTFVWIGYLWGNRRFEGRDAKFAPWLNRTLRIEVTAAAWGVAWLLSMLAILTGRSGYLSSEQTVWTQYISFAQYVSMLAGFILLIHHLKTPSLAGWAWLFLWSASEIFLGLLLGTKSAAFILVYIFIIWFYVRGTFSWRFVVAGMIFISLTVPISQAFRQELLAISPDKQNNLSLFGRTGLLDNAIERVLSQPFSELMASTRETAQNRQSGWFEVAAAIVVAHPQPRPYVGSQILNHALYNLIPRVLWPGKQAGHPQLYKVAELYLGYPEGLTLTSPGYVGDSYRAGGVPFMFIFFVALGFIFAWGYRQGPMSGNEAGLAFYMVLLILFIFQDGNVFKTIFSLYRNVAVLWILLTYVFTQPKEEETVPETLPQGTTQ